MFAELTDMVSFQQAKKIQKEKELSLKKNPPQWINPTPELTEEEKEAIRRQVGLGSRKSQNPNPEDQKEEIKDPEPLPRRSGRFAPSKNLGLCKNCAAE